MAPVAALLESDPRRRLTDDEVRQVAREAEPGALMARAGRLRDLGHGEAISYSRKVFIPLTHLCRDVCHYCTFAERPRAGHAAFLSPGEVLAIARAGAEAGCTEALFTLGDKPELKWKPAAEALQAMGHATTLDYLAARGFPMWAAVVLGLLFALTVKSLTLL
jgi:FO synthase